MFNNYDPWELLIRWSKGEFSLKDAITYIFKYLVKIDHHRKLNDRDIIRHQVDIEEFSLQLSNHEARIKLLEQKLSDDYNKGNGMTPPIKE